MKNQNYVSHPALLTLCLNVFLFIYLFYICILHFSNRTKAELWALKTKERQQLNEPDEAQTIFTAKACVLNKSFNFIFYFAAIRKFLKLDMFQESRQNFI